MALVSKEPDGEEEEADDPLIKDAMLGKTEERTDPAPDPPPDPLPDPLTDGARVVAELSSPMEMNGNRDFHPDFRSLIGSGSSGGGGARIAFTICLVTSASSPARGDRMDGKRNDPDTGLRRRVERKGRRAKMRVAQGALMMMIVSLDHSCCSLLSVLLARTLSHFQSRSLSMILVTDTVTLSITFQYRPLVAT